MFFDAFGLLLDLIGLLLDLLGLGGDLLGLGLRRAHELGDEDVRVQRLQPLHALQHLGGRLRWGGVALACTGRKVGKGWGCV